MIDEILNLPDVSFIDDKQLEQVQAEMIRDYQAKKSFSIERIRSH